MMDLFELNRKVDRLLFDALSDKPEPTYERTVNTNVLSRGSMKPLGQNNRSFLNEANSKTIGHSKFDTKKKRFIYTSKIKDINQKK